MRSDAWYFASAVTVCLLSGCVVKSEHRQARRSISYNDKPINFRNTNVSELVNREKTPEEKPSGDDKPKTGFLANLPDGFEQPTDDVGRNYCKR